MRELVVATRNQKKLKEIRDILKGLKIKVTSLADYGSTPRIIENGKSFPENAVKKATVISRFTKKLSLGEDSGLCVDALGGAPGIYSSRFSGKGKSDLKNNLKLLKLLGKRPLKERKAHYICAVAIAENGKLRGVVEGRCDGYIGFSPAGRHGFGYDPLFIIPRFGKSFAQLGEKIKHTMSHRYHALKKAKKIIKKFVVNKSSG